MAGPYQHTEKTLSAYKNTAYVLLGGALCKAWQLIFSCFSLCALVKRCFPALIKRERGTAKVPLSHFPLLAVPKAHATTWGGFSLGAEGSACFLAGYNSLP